MAASQVGVGEHGPIIATGKSGIPRPIPAPRGESIAGPGSLAMIACASDTARQRFNKLDAPFGSVVRSEWFKRSLMGFR
jgi:hypothetical protein